MDPSQHKRIIRAARKALDKKNNANFAIVSSMLLSADGHIIVRDEIRDGELRIRAFGLAKDRKYYTCIYTKRGSKKRIISAWYMGKSKRKTKKFIRKLEDGNNLTEHMLIMEQEPLAERQEMKMKDWTDYPVDRDYWEKEMPEGNHIVKVMEGTADQYLKQKYKLGEDLLFLILGRKYGSEDIGDGQTFYRYYPITKEDIRKYG